MHRHSSDQDLIQAIRDGGAPAEAALRQIYDQNRQMIMQFVQKNNGNREQGKDLLQDAVVVLYERVRKGDFELTSKLSTYLYSIARFTWLNQLKRLQTESRILDTREVNQADPGHLPAILRREQADQIKALFERLGSDCQKILQWSIYDHYTAQEICDRMHFQNEQVVRNKKYKCLRSLKQLVAQHPQVARLIKSLDHGS